MVTQPIPLLKKEAIAVGGCGVSAGRPLVRGSGHLSLACNTTHSATVRRALPEPWQNFPRDKYEVGEQLGFGGMGVVYEGVHRLTGRRVALKTLRTEYHTTVEAIDRFIQEARVLAQVAGAGVVQLYDCEVGEFGVPYLVMERLEGEDLRDWLDRRTSKSISKEAMLRVVIEVARVLAGVHSKGVVHRDVKPENIFLSHGGLGRIEIKLIDFGVAKAPQNRTRLTLVEHAVGSLLYMSPEQLSDSRDVTPASDVWSVGMLMMELLLGSHPYPSELSDAQLICRILSDDSPRLRDYLVVPDALEDLVGRCLAREPEARYPNAQALADALVECARQLDSTNV